MPYGFKCLSSDPVIRPAPCGTADAGVAPAPPWRGLKLHGAGDSAHAVPGLDEAEREREHLVRVEGRRVEVERVGGFFQSREAAIGIAGVPFLHVLKNGRIYR